MATVVHRAAPTHAPPAHREEAPRAGSSMPPEARDLLEIYCFLACMGPESLDPDRAARSIRSHQGPDRVRWLGRLLDPSERPARSREIGCLLAETLAGRGRETASVLASLLPALVRADTAAGFTVLRHVAAAASPALAEELSEVLLSMVVAESIGDGDPERGRTDRVERLRYLLSVLTRLSLAPASRSRLFLALSQTLDAGEAVRDVILGSLFPSGVDEGLAVVAQGGERALRAVIAGAAARPNGKSEFYATCRSVMDMGLHQGLPVLGRVYRLLDLRDGGHRALAAMVRASLLLAVERAVVNGTKVRRLLPDTPDLSCLDLLTVVTPGIAEPARTEVCDYLIEGAGRILRGLGVTRDDCDSFVQVVVGAVVLHREPDRAGAEVRKMILDTAGVLHVRAQTGLGALDAVEPFQTVVSLLAAEFRRRQALTTCLAPVLPLVADFAPPDPSRMDWASVEV